MKYGIVGAGIWGTVFANYLANKGFNVKIWAYEKEVANSINKFNENSMYFKGAKLNKKIQATNDINEIANTDIIINAVPVQFMDEIWKSLDIDDNKIIINLSKGIEIGTMNFPVDIIKKYTNENKIYLLSGPSFAEEVYSKMHTAVVLAGKINDVTKKIQKKLRSNFFRVYLNKDIIGIEISSALKNVMAIASGIVEGLGLGKNTRSALITRGLAEITRLGKAMGANIKTFSGLAGMGDLVLTCTDSKSRNYSFGKLLTKSYSIDDALKNAGGIVEGYYTVKNAEGLSNKYSVEMPITKAIYDIIYQNADIENIIKRLMKRELKNELWGL